MPEANGGEKLGAARVDTDAGLAGTPATNGAGDLGGLAMGDLIVASGLPPESAQRWQRQFVSSGRTALQSIWRRHQFDWNRESSGYQEGDARRKILQYKDGYELSEGAGGLELSIARPYLWVTVAMPKEEVFDYEDMVLGALEAGGWQAEPDDESRYAKRFVRDGFVFEYSLKNEQEEDALQDRTFPDGYIHFEAVFRGEAVDLSPEERFLPWGVVNASYRPKDIRGEPTVLDDVGAIRDLLPMQVELGCGPSVEAGLPPLHYLHEIYRIQDKEGHFIYGAPSDDLLVEVLTRTNDFYRKAGLLYGHALTAELPDFYKLIKDLHDEGTVVGDVITNSIDGLCHEAGLPEQNVRRYERSLLVPDMQFDPRAKSLLVVGSHADRRLTRKAARRSGLQVIYVDPEGYEENGEFIAAPMEAPKDEDIHYRMTAQTFADEWHRIFG